MTETKDWIKYQIYCETDQRWEYVTLEDGDPEPTTCPVDTAHQVNLSSVDVVDRRSIYETALIEETVKTGGHFHTRGLTIDADCDATTEHVEVAFLSQSAMAVSYTTTELHRNDMVSLSIAKNTPVGVVVAPIQVGSNVIAVSPTVFNYAFPGPCWASIYDGTNRAELGRIKSLDKNAQTVTTEHASEFDFAAGPTTVFQITIKTISDLEIGAPSSEIIGQSKIGGSYMREGTPITIAYTNRSLPWPIGSVTQDVQPSSSIIAVDQDVLDAVELGDKLQLADKQQPTIAIGQVTRIDKLNGTITVSGVTSGTFLAATPTLVVKASKKFVARVELLQ